MAALEAMNLQNNNAEHISVKPDKISRVNLFWEVLFSFYIFNFISSLKLFTIVCRKYYKM